jgi:hypothetical protein
LKGVLKKVVMLIIVEVRQKKKIPKLKQVIDMANSYKGERKTQFIDNLVNFFTSGDIQGEAKKYEYLNSLFDRVFVLLKIHNEAIESQEKYLDLLTRRRYDRTIDRKNFRKKLLH